MRFLVAALVMSITFMITPLVHALPPRGAVVPRVTVEDLAGRKHPLPDPTQPPIIVFYEDKDAGNQNVRARVAIGRYTDRPENRGRFRFVAVGDVSKWDWWPAKGYALKAIRDEAKKDDTEMLLDWKGEVRKRWGLTEGKSGVLIVAPDGRVLFAGEGPLSDAQIAAACAALDALGGVR